MAVINQSIEFHSVDISLPPPREQARPPRLVPITPMGSKLDEDTGKTPARFASEHSYEFSPRNDPKEDTGKVVSRVLIKFVARIRANIHIVAWNILRYGRSFLPRTSTREYI